MDPIENTIELFENERYAPIGGWSSGSLLPTDRCGISTKDGSVGWKNISEAETGYLSAGWVWAASSQWKVKALTPCDTDGWEYAVNFGSIDEGSSGVKGMTHFVRRRRLQRTRVFSASNLCQITHWTCDHCDHEEVDKWSHLLLQACCSQSIARHPRQLTDAKLNAIKTELVNSLLLTSSYPDVAGLEAVEKSVEGFTSQSRSGWSLVSATLGGSDTESAARRLAEVSTLYFPAAERNILAKAIIRHHDLGCQHHCEVVSCGEACKWVPAMCPNDDCGVIVSKHWLQKHDDICPEKIVPCDRCCGDQVIRRMMSIHLTNSCPLRPVECPFAKYGCICELVHGTLPHHLDTCVGSHLLLAVAKLDEQQKVIDSMRQYVVIIDEKQKSQAAMVAKVETGIAAVEAAIVATEKKQTSALQSEVSRMNSRISNELSSLNSQLSSNIRTLQQSVAEVTRDVQAFKK